MDLYSSRLIITFGLIFLSIFIFLTGIIYDFRQRKKASKKIQKSPKDIKEDYWKQKSRKIEEARKQSVEEKRKKEEEKQKYWDEKYRHMREARAQAIKEGRVWDEDEYWEWKHKKRRESH